MIALFLGGCTTTAYISSLTDPNYSVVKTDPIYIMLKSEASIPDRQFYSFLKSKMVANGFNIVEFVSESKYILLFQRGSKTSQINSTLSLPSTSTTSGYVGNTYYSGKTTSTQEVPYSYNYTVKKIYLNLYAAVDVEKGKYFTVWEGYIGAGANEYKSYSGAILKELLDVFGTNYEAHTPINRRNNEPSKTYETALREKAEKGDVQAQFNLGRAYAIGKDVTQSDSKSIKWYRKAAEQGHAEGQLILGFMHEIGKDVTQSDREAAKWYSKAAEQGNAEGQFILGDMYRRGKGMSQSDSEAVKWFRKAAKQGNAGAKKELKEMGDYSWIDLSGLPDK